MDAYPDEYDAFVEEVNGKSFKGIQRVYSLAVRLAPQLMAKAKEQVHGDLNRTEPDASIFTADDTLAEQLVAEFRNTMRTRLASKSTQRDIAMMKVALEEAGITVNCSACTFRDALQAEFPEYAIVLERGIQRCYKFLLDTDARTGNLQKDEGEDRILIDEIIRYFTDDE